jgi:RHS repeat-associated protein
MAGKPSFLQTSVSQILCGLLLIQSIPLSAVPRPPAPAPTPAQASQAAAPTPADGFPPFPSGAGGPERALPAGAAAVPAKSSSSEISILPGWNLVSLPRTPADPSAAAVLEGLGGRAFAYAGCDAADPWKVWDPQDPEHSDLTSLDPKLGVWIESPAASLLPVTGTEPAVTTIHLCTGWNLVGYPVSQPRSVTGALASIAGRYARVVGFDAADAADPWEIYDVAVPAWANDLQVLQPGHGYWILATAEADLVLTAATDGPVVQIASPLDLSTVTGPADVIGTVGGDDLREWTLSFRAAGEEAWTPLAAGTAPVLGGTLGHFDPTLLLNGLYEIEVEATDGAGRSRSAVVATLVDGQQKIGNFTLTFRDLEIPLSGIPLAIHRIYDSRDKKTGDFGAGWRLEIHQGSYRNNRTPGDGWQLGQRFLPCDTIREASSHLTTIRLSDREIYRFRISLFHGVPTQGGCFAQARFDFVGGPVPGASLAILGSVGNDQVLYQNAAAEVVDAGSLEPYEPRRVRLTTRDGRTYDLDLHDGVTRAADANGNALEISATAIRHSDGRSVALERDSQGRITAITDPQGQSLHYTYSGAGDLETVTDTEGRTFRYAYDGRHGLLDLTDPRGVRAVRNEYDATGRLVRHVDAAGKTIEYTHDLAAHQETVTDRLGHSRLLTYDARGNVVREAGPEGGVRLREYDDHDHLLSETDPLGRKALSTYDANGNLTSITDPLGHRALLTYDGNGRPLTVTDPRGGVTAQTWDARGNLLSVRDPLGNTVSYTYDARGNRLTEVDAEGALTRFEVDALGHVIRQVDPLGTETLSERDAFGRETRRTTHRTTPGGVETLVWTYTWDDRGLLTGVTEPDGGTAHNTYDELGKLQESVDRLGRKTDHTYDAQGHPTGTAYPDGTREAWAYDAEGRLLTATDRAGRITRYERDGAGRLTRTVYPDGAAVARSYDAAGQLILLTDARGGETRFEYDAAGERTRIVDALGRAIAFAYDENHNEVAVTLPGGETTHAEYDAAGRLVRRVFPDGTSQTVAYDRAGRRVAATDAAGRTTRFGLDALGRLAAVTDPLGQTTRFDYDEMGNRTAQTDAAGHVTRFEHDRLGRLTRRVLPLGAAESLAYDAMGNLVRRTGFDGAVTTYTYDAADRLIGRGQPDGSAIAWTYTPTGRRATVTDGRGTTAYAYDGRDRLVSLTDPAGRSLTYAYDAAGNRTSLSVQVGGQAATTAYAYDVLGRLQSVTDALGRPYAFEYDANGNRAALRYPNGVETTYAYDALQRLTQLATRSGGGVLQSYDYTLSAVGSRTRVREQDGTVRDFEYDADSRLTAETVTSGAGAVHRDAFFYDAVGNRLRLDRTGLAGGPLSVASTYDERDRLLTAGDAGYTWDEEGRLTGRSGPAGATFSWGPEQTLTRVTLADGTVEAHTYDADGNRVRTEVIPPSGPHQVTDFLIDPTGPLPQVVAEIGGDGTLEATYVRGGGELLSVIRPGGGPGAGRFYHADGLGSIRRLTDESGAVTDTYELSAFGELLAHTGADSNPYLFAGQRRDPLTGLYDNRARWLDPETGRFASMDPAAGSAYDPPSLHKYAYAGSDPVNRIDPTGRFGVSIGDMAAVGAVIGAITSVVIFRPQGPLETLKVAVYGALVGAALFAFMTYWAVAGLGLGAVGIGLGAGGLGVGAAMGPQLEEEGEELAYSSGRLWLGTFNTAKQYIWDGEWIEDAQAGLRWLQLMAGQYGGRVLDQPIEGEVEPYILQQMEEAEEIVINISQLSPTTLWEFEQIMLRPDLMDKTTIIWGVTQ